MGRFRLPLRLTVSATSSSLSLAPSSPLCRCSASSRIMESSFWVLTLTLTLSAAGDAEDPWVPAPLDWWYCRLRLAGEGVLAAGGGDMSAQMQP